AHACIELLARAGDDRERVSPRERLIDRPSPSLDRIYQLGLWSAIFFAIFLDFHRTNFSRFHRTFHQFRSGWLCYFCF
ncbi:MAG: hypothetical protein WAV78_35700, partial [Xanthobacteraceae bacterium]